MTYVPPIRNKHQVINRVPVIQKVWDREAFLGQWWPSQQDGIPGPLGQRSVEQLAGPPSPRSEVSAVPQAHRAGSISALTRPFDEVTGASIWVHGPRGWLSSSLSDAGSSPYPRINFFPA